MQKETEKKKRREKSKTRQWERERRDRLTESFQKLKETLPNYDASKTLSKIEVLTEAASVIKDLSEKLKSVLVDSENEKNTDPKLKVSADIIKKLQDRVKKLLVRNEELVNLLKTAGIRVPSAFGSVKNFSKPKKYSNLITEEQGEVCKKKFQKENKENPPKSPKPKKTGRSKQIKFRKVSSNSKLGKSINSQLNNVAVSPKYFIIVSQPRLTNGSCFNISKNTRKTNDSVLTNSLLIKSSMVTSSNVKSSVPVQPLANLKTGDVVFAKGAAMPVPTPIQYPVIPTILSNPIQTNLSTFIIVSNNSRIYDSKVCKPNSKSSLPQSQFRSNFGTSTLPPIKSKTCVTRTTQINKVPIPALTSKYNRYVCLEGTEPKTLDSKCTDSTLKSVSKKVASSLPKSKQVTTKRNQKQSLKDTKKSKKEETNAVSSASKPEVLFTTESSPISQKSNNTTVAIGELLDRTQEENGSELQAKVTNLENESSKAFDDMENNESVADKSTENIQTSNSCNGLFKAEEINGISKDMGASNITQKSTAAEILPKTTAPSSNSEKNISSNTITPNSITTPCKTSCDRELKKFDTNIVQSDITSKIAQGNDLKSLELNMPQSELSNDIFASFQVPTNCQNPGSTSPTAAFLLAFPLVSSGIKVTEVIGEENSDSHAGTPNLLQIGTMEITKTTQSYSESLTPSLFNFDSFNFFSKDNCSSGFYNNVATSAVSQTTNLNVRSSSTLNNNFGTNFADTSVTFSRNGTVTTNQIIDMNVPKLNSIENLKNSVSAKVDDLNQCAVKQISTEKGPVHSKNTNHHNNSHIDQVSKDLKIQPYINYSFDKSYDLANINSTMMDLNSYSFPSKLNVNENYNKNKSAEPAKSSENCIYPNYKDCNLMVTNSNTAGKNYNAVYTKAATNSYFYNPGLAVDNRSFNSNCSIYSDFRKSEGYNSYVGSQEFTKDKINHNGTQKNKIITNKPVNWMTSPSTTITYKPEYHLPPLTKEHNFNSTANNSLNAPPTNNYFNTSSVYNHNDYLNNAQDLKKTGEIPLPSYSTYQRTDVEENQFSWSPNKIPQFLDPAHSHSFVTTTLPTLVGDLALNTPIIDHKIMKDRSRENRRKLGNCDNQNNQTNFLSVSQLVEHNQDQAPAKVMSRRGSGNRTRTNTPKIKRNKDISSYQKSDKIMQSKQFDNNSVTSSLFNESKPRPSNNKNITSSYSAEALIGNHLGPNTTAKRNNFNNPKSIVPNFLSENVVSYFPTVDVAQESNYMQSNQSIQPNTFSQNFPTNFQNSSYTSNNFIPSACSITSTFMSNNNFAPNSNNQDFLGDNSNMFHTSNNPPTKDRSNYGKSYYRHSDKDEKNQPYHCKRGRKRNSNEAALPSFDIPFLSVPGAVNSPLLPEDFHTTYIPPTTLYPCKNPLYSKPNADLNSTSIIPPLPAIPTSKSNLHQSEMNQSANSVGTSLTNFNLSTIFPEINKGAAQDGFSGDRHKEFLPASKGCITPSSLQVPFNSKPSIPFGAFGT